MPIDSRSDGLVLCRSIIEGSWLEDWRSRIYARYQGLEAARDRNGPAAACRLVAPGQRFLPTASSLTLGDVVSEGEIGAVFSGIGAEAATVWVANELGGQVVCDLDQAWVRRQYAPGRYPPFHAPHGWHQDGALGFDYLSHPGGNFPTDALLSMVTCWIPLNPCGAEAPGLELVTRRPAGLLAPGELTDPGLRSRFPARDFWRPIMKAGDALLFRGDILHRTHVSSSMTKDRTSVELRFFPADDIPSRLKADRFIGVKVQDC